MGQPSLGDIKQTFGPTDLTDPQIEQAREDAKIQYQSLWKSSVDDALDSNSEPTFDEADEYIKRLLTCHLMSDTEPQISDDSEGNLSSTTTLPTGNIMEWLKNTTHGRSLINFLKSINVTPEKQEGVLPGVFD